MKVINKFQNDQKIRVAAFDLDHTLIKPHNNRVFPKDKNDFIIISGVVQKLKKLKEDGFTIIIFTNQTLKEEKFKEFEEKLENVFKEIGNITTYIGLEFPYRKPCRMIYDKFVEDCNGLIESSFYVGDACRADSFSYSDLKFAINIGIPFYDARTYFTETVSVPLTFIPRHPLDDVLTEATVETLTESSIWSIEEQTIIILVGPPACGKSSYCIKFPKFVTICQDTLKTKQKVISSFISALKKGLSVIIDRKNEYEKDRKELIDLAKNINTNIIVKILFFDVSKELAMHLNAYRNIKTGRDIPHIVFNKYYSIKSGLEDPRKFHPNETTIVPFVLNNDDPLLKMYLI